MHTINEWRSLGILVKSSTNSDARPANHNALTKIHLFLRVGRAWWHEWLGLWEWAGEKHLFRLFLIWVSECRTNPQAPVWRAFSVTTTTPCPRPPQRNQQTQQTRDVDTMLCYCWADVVDGGPAIIQHQVNVSRLMRSPWISLYCH